MRENTANTLVMIQHALMEYNFENEESVPVLLDISSLKDNCILLLDTFFIVLIW